MSPAVPHRTIVFSHANSFPAATYQPLFEGWRAAGFDVFAVDKFGHDPRYPVTQNWPHLVTELKDFIEREVGHPAYLVGHSLGGFLSMMVAGRYPHLAQGVVVLDSPVLSGWKSFALGLAKRFGDMERAIPASRVARERRHEWPDLEAVHEHFSTKPKFAAFHPDVLNAYLAHATVEKGNESAARRLSFQREVESRIYKTMPHMLPQYFRTHPHQCPVAFIGGTRSRETKQVGTSGIRQLVGANMSWIEGTHLYPFENPQATVQEVLRWLGEFGCGAAR